MAPFLESPALDRPLTNCTLEAPLRAPYKLLPLEAPLRAPHKQLPLEAPLSMLANPNLTLTNLPFMRLPHPVRSHVEPLLLNYPQPNRSISITDSITNLNYCLRVININEIYYKIIVIRVLQI